jgi:hypothetical protein
VVQLVAAIDDQSEAMVVLAMVKLYFSTTFINPWLSNFVPEAVTHMRTLTVSEVHWKGVLQNLETALEARVAPEATAVPVEVDRGHGWW